MIVILKIIKTKTTKSLEKIINKNKKGNWPRIGVIFIEKKSIQHINTKER